MNSLLGVTPKECPQLLENDPSKIVGTQMNIVYITTRCNLACHYCYEEQKRSDPSNLRDITKQEIDDYITDVIKREGVQNRGHFLFFGGECLLRPDMVDYFLSEVYRRKGGEIHWCLETNGTLIKKNFDYLLAWNKFIKARGGHFFVQISYDGPVSDRRVWRDSQKSAKAQIEEALALVHDSELRMSIGYTTNYSNKHRVVEDLVYIFERYPKLHRFSMTFNWSELGEVHPTATPYQFKDLLEAGYLYKLYDIYGIKICPCVCSQCLSCFQHPTTSDVYLVPGEGVKARPKYYDYQEVFFNNEVDQNANKGRG